MEKLKNYYHSFGLYYLTRKIKLNILPIKKLKSIDIYKTYIENNFLFNKYSSNIPINKFLKENYWTELSHRKIIENNKFYFHKRYLLRIKIKTQEFKVIENLLKEKDM